MFNATVTITLHCTTEAALDALLHTVDLMTAPPSGREDWTREISVERAGS